MPLDISHPDKWRLLLTIVVCASLSVAAAQTREAPLPKNKPDWATPSTTLAMPTVDAQQAPVPIPKPLAHLLVASRPPLPKVKPPVRLTTAQALCARIADRLSSVTNRECTGFELQPSGGVSVNSKPILVAEFASAVAPIAHARVLIVGGTHGDEFSSVSVVFKWMALLAAGETGPFDWKVTPVLNPDGLLQRPATRTNANGIDLNRNFPTPNWAEESQRYWVHKTGKNPRRFPGLMPMSEPESRWLVSEIGLFQPDVIIATHAPHGIVDFDGPPEGPEQVGSLGKKLLGTFPGSLGNFAGQQRDLPVVTVEFSSAGSMPSSKEIENMWNDLQMWLLGRFPTPKEGLRAQLSDI